MHGKREGAASAAVQYDAAESHNLANPHPCMDMTQAVPEDVHPRVNAGAPPRQPSLSRKIVQATDLFQQLDVEASIDQRSEVYRSTTLGACLSFGLLVVALVLAYSFKVAYSSAPFDKAASVEWSQLNAFPITLRCLCTDGCFLSHRYTGADLEHAACPRSACTRVPEGAVVNTTAYYSSTPASGLQLFWTRQASSSGSSTSPYQAEMGSDTDGAAGFEVISDMVMESNGGIMPWPSPVFAGISQSLYVRTHNRTRAAGQGGHWRHEHFISLVDSTARVQPSAGEWTKRTRTAACAQCCTLSHTGTALMSALLC
jgi:hypothetical protein